MYKPFFTFLILISSWVGFAQEKSSNTLWYKSPANNWHQALPIGNGRLGAMVFGRPNLERIQLNEESLWAGKPINANNPGAGEKVNEIRHLLFKGQYRDAYDSSEKYLVSNPPRFRSYQTLGDLLIDFGNAGNVSDYRRSLDLSTGIAVTRFQQNGVQYTREQFVSAPDNCMVIRLTADKPGRINCKLLLTRERDATISMASGNRLLIQGQIMDVDTRNEGEGGANMKFGAILQAVSKGGDIRAANNAMLISGASEVTIVLTASTDYRLDNLNFDRTINPKKVCEKIIDRATAYPYEQLKQRHLQEFMPMFGRMTLHLGSSDFEVLPTDKRIDSLKKGSNDQQLYALYFQYGRYLLMSSSRPPGKLPANLQGIWNEFYEAPWNSDYHTNINLEMNYWPAAVCNLSETIKPLADFVDAYRVPGRVTAKTMYNSRGWNMHHATDIFGRTGVIAAPHWGQSPLMGTWLCMNLWEYFLFTGDTVYLKQKIYPILKEAAIFVHSFLVPGPDGYLMSGPSHSPENSFVDEAGNRSYIDMSPAIDITLIRELYSNCLKAIELLNIDRDFAESLQADLDKLPRFQISKKDGRLQEWYKDYRDNEPGHRHLSHLIGLYPGSVITHNPALVQAAAKSIETRLANKGGATGWSCAWLINCFARLKKPEEAYEQLQKLLGNFTLDNMMDRIGTTGDVFQIDGNFGGTAGIAELLVQSHGDYIELLPALPKAWENGSVTGICARGSFEIDMKWRMGSVTEATVFSKNGLPLNIMVNGKLQSIKTKAGQQYTLSF